MVIDFSRKRGSAMEAVHDNWIIMWNVAFRRVAVKDGGGLVVSIMMKEASERADCCRMESEGVLIDR